MNSWEGPRTSPCLLAALVIERIGDLISFRVGGRWAEVPGRFSIICRTMRPMTVTVDVPASRERVFEYLCDLANRPCFADTFQKEFRLARVDSVGLGASARYKIGGPLHWGWAEFEIAGFEPPQTIVETGRAGRVGRIGTRTEFKLEETGADATQLTVTVWADGTRLDDLRAVLGGRGWLRHKYRKSLHRLAELFKEGPATASAERVTVGGLSRGSDPLAFGSTSK